MGRQVTETLTAGGANSGWGSTLPDDCFEMTNAAFENVFYQNNWAANVKAISYYMFYGYVTSDPDYHSLEG